MLWTLLAIVVAGLGAAGIALLLRKLTRNKLPKWIVPLFGGLGIQAMADRLRLEIVDSRAIGEDHRLLLQPAR